MIIWGSTGKEKTIGRGDFYCPQCQRMSPFTHRRASRYFTLYFIPLFPMETLGEFVQCEQCGGDFSQDILDLSPEQIEEMLQPWRCPYCGNNNPAGEARCLGCAEDRTE